MLKDNEKEDLLDLLSHAVKPAEAFTLDQLEGYLFGVVITPDETIPGEWFEDIFGPSMASFEDEKEANRKFANLADVYHRLKEEHRSGKLDFPFNVDRLDAKQLDQMRSWASGLEKALTLRSDIWVPDEVLESEERDKDAEHIMNSLMVILGVAYPEQISEIFEDIEADEDDDEISEELIANLPLAVSSLQVYAMDVEQQRLTQNAGSAAQPTVPAVKVGRNDPCPCGSGRKYKKCCGLN